MGSSQVRVARSDANADLQRLASDLLGMSVDERLETLRRYVELRASVEPVEPVESTTR